MHVTGALLWSSVREKQKEVTSYMKVKGGQEGRNL